MRIYKSSKESSVQYSPTCAEGANDSDTNERRREKRHIIGGKRGPPYITNSASRIRGEFRNLKRQEEESQPGGKDAGSRDQRHSLSRGRIRPGSAPSSDCNNTSNCRGRNYTPRCVHGQSSFRKICETNRGGIIPEHRVDIFLKKMRIWSVSEKRRAKTYEECVSNNPGRSSG